jgi:Leucine-rich repeat (LRR) protein
MATTMKNKAVFQEAKHRFPDEVPLDLAFADWLKKLKSRKTLRVLDLGLSPVTDNDLRELAELPHLQELSFDRTAITDAGLAALAKMTELRKLDLSGLSLSAAGFRHLQCFAKLESLTLYNAKISDVDAALQELTYLHELREINLAGTALTDAGAAQLVKFTKLRDVNLASTKLTDRGLAKLLECSDLQELGLSDVKPGSTGMRIIGRMKNLRKLYFGDSGVDDDGLSELCSLPHLEVLLLRGESVTDAGMPALRKLARLRELELSGSAITDAGLAHVQELTDLETLDLRETRVTDRGLEWLVNLKKLECLFIYDTAVTGPGVGNIQAALPDCEVHSSYARKKKSGNVEIWTRTHEYKRQERFPIHSVRFSPDGACLAVGTEDDRVLWFETAKWISRRGGWESGLQIVDLAFSSTGEQLAVIGRARQADSDDPESELTVLSSAPFGAEPSAWQRIPETVDGRIASEYFTAPMFLPPPLRNHPLLVGTVDGVIAINPLSGAARFPLTTPCDFGNVTRRGLVYLPRTARLVVAFDMHPNLCLIAYRRDGRGRFREPSELERFIDGQHAGAALSPSGRLLVVGVQDCVRLHPVEASADARIGALQIFETEGLSKVGTFEVRGEIARDFGREDLGPGNARRMPDGSAPDSPFVYAPRAMMSNPAFLDDRRVAFGMPGGEVRLLDVETGGVETLVGPCRAPVYRLDCAPAKRRIAAGFADGTLLVWRI